LTSTPKGTRNVRSKLPSYHALASTTRRQRCRFRCSFTGGPRRRAPDPLAIRSRQAHHHAVGPTAGASRRERVLMPTRASRTRQTRDNAERKCPFGQPRRCADRR
jgi:hypothetical protein